MGMSGISKSQVSRLCAEIDDEVKPFLSRPIEGNWLTWGSTPRRGIDLRLSRLKRTGKTRPDVHENEQWTPCTRAGRVTAALHRAQGLANHAQHLGANFVLAL
jgi:hypothetical protein